MAKGQVKKQYHCPGGGLCPPPRRYRDVLYIFGYVSVHRLRIWKEKSIFLPRTLEPNTRKTKKTLSHFFNIFFFFSLIFAWFGEKTLFFFFFSRHFFVKTLSHFFNIFFFFFLVLFLLDSARKHFFFFFFSRHFFVKTLSHFFK